MTKDELMQPRYKLMADYPKQDFEVGEILYAESNGLFFVYTDNGKWQIHPEWYPRLFKELFWWEDRNPGDMPEYVKHINTKVITKTTWTKSVYFFGNEVPAPFNSVIYLLPATKQEYNEYRLLNP